MGCRTRRGLAIGAWRQSTECLIIRPILSERCLDAHASRRPSATRSNRRNARPAPNVTRRIRDVREDRIEIRFRHWSILRCTKPRRSSSLASSAQARKRPGPRCCCRGLTVVAHAAMRIAEAVLGSYQPFVPKGARHYYKCTGLKHTDSMAYPSAAIRRYMVEARSIVWTGANLVGRSEPGPDRVPRGAIGQLQDARAIGADRAVDRQMTTLRPASIGSSTVTPEA